MSLVAIAVMLSIFTLLCSASFGKPQSSDQVERTDKLCSKRTFSDKDKETAEHMYDKS